MNTPARTPFKQLQIFSTAQTRRLFARKSATRNRSSSDKPEVRDLRSRLLNVDSRWPRPDDNKVYTAKTALCIIWESQEGALFQKGVASAVVQAMLDQKLLPVGRSQIVALRKHHGHGTRHRMMRRFHEHRCKIILLH